MAHDLDQMLSQFKQEDYAVRLSTGVASLMPFAEAIPYLGSVEAAARKALPEHWERLAKKVKELSAEQGPQSALSTADLMDRGDRGIALYSGVRGVYKAVKGTGEATETDPQQLADAALKALGIAWITWRLFPGDDEGRMGRLFGTPAGQALVAYYLAIDVALPFTDNVLSSGGSFFSDVVQKAAEENAPRLATVGDAGKALQFLRTMGGKLSELATTAAQHVVPVTQMASKHLPGVMAGADTVAGVVATAADTLNVYRYLGARLVLDDLVGEATTLVKADLVTEEQARKAAEDNARKADEERLAASSVKKDYKLDEGLPAASLKNSPIKVTRSAPQLPEEKKKGCGFCLAAFLVLPPLLVWTAWGPALAQVFTH